MNRLAIHLSPIKIPPYFKQTLKADSKKFPESKLVLVIEDNRELLHSIGHALEAHGYQVLLALDGNEGIASIELYQPELVITDIMLPKRSGILVLEYLRTQVEQPIPVIMITGSAGNRQRTYAEYLGISSYFVKPFELDELISSVDQVFDNQKRNRGE